MKRQTHEEALAQRRREDAVQIAKPHMWPNEPILPMKRYVAGRLPEMGVIYSRMGLSTVWQTNMWDLPKREEHFASLAHTKYESIEAMLADGWMVD